MLVDPVSAVGDGAVLVDPAATVSDGAVLVDPAALVAVADGAESAKILFL